MLSWLAEKMIARNMKSIRAGDVGPTLAMDAEDVKFTFPGESSFAPGANDKRELEQWLNRFASLGLQIYPDQVILKGFRGTRRSASAATSTSMTPRTGASMRTAT